MSHRAAAVVVAISVAGLMLSSCGGDDEHEPRTSAAETTWEIDRSMPPPDRSSRVIPVLIDELNCNGGEPPEVSRIHEPEVVYGNDSITVTYLLDAPKGLDTCPTSPPARIDLALTAPLGDRALLDGSRPEEEQQVWPPED